MSFTFLLGTHKVGWLADPRFVEVPLFISRHTLMDRKTLPRAVGSWGCDSGGFMVLQMEGRWSLAPEKYIAELRRYRDEIGGLLWAAPQDWMCEPVVIAGLVERRKATHCKACVKAKRRHKGKTPTMRTVELDADERPMFACDLCGEREVGKPPAIHVGRWRRWAAEAGPVMAPTLAAADKFGLDAVVVFHGTALSVEEHQRRTVENFLELRRMAPDVPVIPVLQGWNLIDYWRCEELYARAGVDLRKEPIVGVGSVCRRQGSSTASRILHSLAAGGLRAHGFGFKMKGLRASRDDLVSADSMTWSTHARRRPPLPGHDKPGPGRPKGHKNCANCPEYALAWRAELLEAFGSSAAPS